MPSLNRSGSPPTRSVERFRLTGPTPIVDRRTHAVRADLADAALADRVFAPHYAKPSRRTATALTTMRSAPADDAEAVSELASGETFSILDASSGWAWGFSDHDHYVGYVPLPALSITGEKATHIVTVAAALVFSKADIKSRVIARLPLGSKVAARGPEGQFIAVQEGFVHERHLMGVEARATDPTTIAEQMVGTPYRWGGRGGDGIDCSGLVQRAFALAGRALPRDSDQQREEGEPIEPAELQRGDLVFLPGHVAIATDPMTLVHANAFWMAVAIEPLADVLARSNGAALICRRLT